MEEGDEEVEVVEGGERLNWKRMPQLLFNTPLKIRSRVFMDMLEKQRKGGQFVPNTLFLVPKRLSPVLISRLLWWH